MLFSFALCLSFLLTIHAVLAPGIILFDTMLVLASLLVVAERQLRLNHRQDDGVITSNWAGCIVGPGDGGFSSITGAFTAVANISGRPASAATAWVGINSEESLFQAGVDLVVSANDTHQYNAWVEWYPAGATFFPEIKVSGEDRIKVTLNVTSTTSGIVTIRNLSNGQKLTQIVTNPSAPLSPVDSMRAEWIVEDFMDFADADTYFANFGTVTFTDAVAIVHGEGSKTPADASASICNIGKNETVLTSVSIDGSSLAITRL
ncbi:peptidase A4 family-domain-containing protein [Chiua virens]|nr:peptidase A4 family-domain-containing protein [Chiua virens]